MNIWKKAAALLLAAALLVMAAPAVFAAGEKVETNSLKELLITASTYKQEDYTMESWQALEAALAQADAALDSSSQDVVNDAYTALALAIFSLVSMDYSPLDQAIANAQNFLKGGAASEFRQELETTIAAAKALYGSRDQVAVNSAAEKINLRVAALQEYIKSKASIEELLSVADNVKQESYTAESWQALQEAVAQARAALESDNLEDMKAASSALASALNHVSAMDYSKLEDALANVEKFLKDEQMADYWQDLQKAFDEAQALLGSIEQERVDRAAEMLNLRVEELREYISDNQKTPVLWIVLLCVSLAGNVALVVLLVKRKKNDDRNQVDDVPLVDYDIDDDII